MVVSNAASPVTGHVTAEVVGTVEGGEAEAEVVAEEEETDPATSVISQAILHATVLRNRAVTVEALEAAGEEEEIEHATDVNSPVILHVTVQMKVIRAVNVEGSEEAEVEEEVVLATTVIRLDILQEIAPMVAKEKSELVTSVDKLDTLQEIAPMVAQVNHEEEEEWTSLVTIVAALATFQEIVHQLKHQVVVAAAVAKIATAVDQLTIWPEIVQTKVTTKSSATAAMRWDTLQEIVHKKRLQLHDLLSRRCDVYDKCHLFNQ